MSWLAMMNGSVKISVAVSNEIPCTRRLRFSFGRVPREYRFHVYTIVYSPDDGDELPVLWPLADAGGFAKQAGCALCAVAD